MINVKTISSKDMNYAMRPTSYDRLLYIKSYFDELDL